LLFIDSDNGLGSPTGDVDDGFALAALLLSGEPIAALASVFGNTPESLAFPNLVALAKACGYEGPILRGASSAETKGPASDFLSGCSQKINAVALGPLTNLAWAQNALERVVIVGGNSKSPGRFPPLWPYEFNLIQDRRATGALMKGQVPLTFVTLDLAGRMQVSWEMVERLRGPVGEYLARHSRRWFQRAKRWKQSATVPIWDLTASALVLWPELFEREQTTASWDWPGVVRFHRGTRPVEIVRNYSPAAVWKRFAELVAQKGA
jgi:inosine-uridine nucleoside N-ribohydrolase